MPNKEVTLRLGNYCPIIVEHVSQGDTDWTWVFQVVDDHGQIYAPVVRYAILAGNKPDGHAFAYLCTKDGDTYKLPPSAYDIQMTAAAGDVRAELRLLGSNGKGLGSCNFTIRVEEGPEGAVTVASDSSLPAYLTILNKIGTIPDDVAGYITEWLETHISGGQGVVVDNTLTVQGAAADAKAAGERLAALDERVEDLENAQIETDATLSQEGAAADAKAVGDAISALVTITPEIKNALLSCLQNVAWATPNGQSYVNALNRALNAGSIVVTGGKFVPNLAVSTGNGIFQLYYDSSTYNRLGFALDGTGDHPMRMASTNPTTEQSFYPIPVPQDARQLKLTLPSSVSFVAYFAKWTGKWSIVASSGAWDTGYGGGTVDISEANDGNLFFACGFRNSSNSAAITGIDRESLKLEWIV